MSQEHLTPPPPIKVPQAATRIYHRDPEWKFHANVGLAKNAIAYSVDYKRIPGRGYQEFARAGEIWVLKDNTWTLLYAIEEKTDVNDLPWRK